MGQEILIIGQSGTGKSTALEELNPQETVITNPAKKALPFKGYKQNYVEWTKDNTNGNLFNIDKAVDVLGALDYVNTQMPHIRNFVLDDANYIMAFEFMARAKEAGYGKYTDIGTNFSNIIIKGKSLRPNLNFIMMMHPEVDTDTFGNKIIKAKTIGKLVDQYLNIEGMFSVVLYSKANKNKDGNMEYVFVTQNDGTNTGKSPRGMFDKLEIPNNLSYVLKKIEEYNN